MPFHRRLLNAFCPARYWQAPLPIIFHRSPLMASILASDAPDEITLSDGAAGAER
jgi:hypothetical protein